ncbi:hypothetical protein [Microbacterium lacus]|uniref:hypothetical protein n=1 Tax=Microbacterium lacus TaxID=415217 RepID=UPI000C2C1B6F|nr:hypothetical protein [Microbacterium lacus]
MVDTERARLREQAHEIFDPIAERFLSRDGVDIGRMFAGEGLRIRGKIFAFVGLDGDIMIKVPAPRTAELIEAGDAERVVMRGSPMREWVTVPASRSERWGQLMEEAYVFVDEITPGGGDASTSEDGAR